MTRVEVQDRLARGLTNTAVHRNSRRTSDIIRANVLTRFNAILGALFMAIVLIGPIQDMLFGLVIVANTAIGIVQELRAKRTLDQLAILGEARPRVWRDGVLTEITMDQVVLDDVIQLGTGDQLVVDGTVIDAAGLEIDESLLTGESESVTKRSADPVLSGSFVVAGSGTYRATRVGREAYAAALAERASTFTLASSELRIGINQILRVITWMFIPVAAVTIYGQLAGHQPFGDTLRGVVAALVPMVPEGLVLLTSIAFAVGVVRLGRRRCLVQELAAIEGLARVDIVCVDKTGTLTETGMRVGNLHLLSGNQDERPELVLAAVAAADPQPNASIRAIADAYPDTPDWPVTSIAAFSSATRWSGVSFADHGDWVIGAPDVLLPSTSSVLIQAEELAEHGLRVLLLGRSSHSVDALTAPGEVFAVALVELEQKIRDDAVTTMDYFRAQGVTVKILSGDNATTVGAVAARLHVPGALKPVDARTLPADPAGLADRVGASSVFGRVTPWQKQQIVAALQAAGHTVAMTGDGVNDVLALKEAHVGVAMGSGSPAARAVAQIVLVDNAFATLPHVVAEGRRVIGNIERVTNLFLIKTCYSILLAVLIGLARLPFPFLPRHLTLIGALTIGIPAFFVALAPNTERVRRDLLRHALRMAVPAGVVAAAATFVSYYAVQAEGSATLMQTRTAAAITLFVIALWALVVVIRPHNGWKVSLVAGMASIFAAVLMVPMSRQFFALDPTDIDSMLTAAVVSVAGMASVEVAWRLGQWQQGPRRRDRGCPEADGQVDSPT